MTEENQLPYIDDLSYSGIVDLVQGDDLIGKQAIIQLTKRLIETKEAVAEAEKHLNSLVRERDHIHAGINSIVKHLSREFPLAVTVPPDGMRIIVISDKNVTIETNVL